MLSFPVPTHWKTALLKVADTTASGNPGLRFGRTASLIIPRLYLSDYFTAIDADELNQLGISHVVSVIEYSPDIPPCITETHRLHVCVADHPDVNILEHFAATTAFIQSRLGENTNNKVLVHCFQGISRSATIVCAYLVATAGMTAPESIAFVQSKRGIVCPNVGFRAQLETYEINLRRTHAHKPLRGQSIMGRILMRKSGRNSSSGDSEDEDR